LAPAPILNQLVHAYKLSLRQFGLAPVNYDPQYNAMTQLGPGEAAAAESTVTMEPLQTTTRPHHYDSNGTKRRSSRTLLDCHTHLQVSRTWQKVLQERQDQDDSDINGGKDDNSQQQQKQQHQKAAKANAARTNASVPSNMPTQSRLHQWYQQQQAQVIASHERALIDAAKQRQQKPASFVINLSEQQEIGMAHALEQTAADQRWTQDSQGGSASASQFFLTPREVATDSNPQQIMQQQVPVRKSSILAGGEDPLQEPKQPPPPSLSMAESFETTLEPSEKDNANIDNNDDDDDEEPEEKGQEDVAMQDNVGDDVNGQESIQGELT
jgi:hypothetical protein